jgi:p-aminobenzoyl-glutamate transporter AbgT
VLTAFHAAHRFASATHTLKRRAVFFIGVAQPVAGDLGFVVVVVVHGLDLTKIGIKKKPLVAAFGKG